MSRLPNQLIIMTYQNNPPEGAVLMPFLAHPWDPVESQAWGTLLAFRQQYPLGFQRQEDMQQDANYRAVFTQRRDQLGGNPSGVRDGDESYYPDPKQQEYYY